MFGLSNYVRMEPSQPKLVRWISALLLSLAFMGCLGCGLQAGPTDPEGTGNPPDRGEETVSVVLGEDYSLPDKVRPEEYSGYIASPSIERPEGSLNVVNWYVSWKDLEPEKGAYNWDLVDTKFAAAEAGGYVLNMHLQNITYGGGNEAVGVQVDQKVPDWVFDEFHLTQDDLINLGWEFDLLVIPGWNPEIRLAFNDLIRAFGEQGYPQSPQLASSYIMGISPSRGEEFWMTQPALDVLEGEHGFNPQVLDDWISSRFAAYAEAFSGVEYKLVWVGKQGAWRYLNSGEYADLALRLVQDAWSLGAGNRSSAIEYYHNWLNEPALGQAVDENGYLTVDETIAPLSSVRFFGDENEEYGDSWVWRFGGRENEPVRYRMSVFRALQMRMRFLWTCAEAEEINPALSRYTAMSLGKTVETSPDAWTYLKESPVTTHESPVGVVKNFERWLQQRDLPGGMTVPAQRTFREFNAGGNYQGGASTWYDDLARRTDVVSGNACIFFDLDDRFRAEGPVQIKVEILDDSSASWHLEYSNGGSSLQATPSFENSHDGQIKTVTFEIADARFVNGLQNGLDFQIVCEGPGDVTVRWVRLIR